MKKLLQSLILTGTAAIVVGLSFSTDANAAYNGKVRQIRLDDNNGTPLCLTGDITKYSILQGAEKLIFTPCRNIREQWWLVNQYPGTNMFQIEMLNRAPNGQKVCATFDVTKVGILPNAPFGVLYPCQNIVQVNHYLHQVGGPWNVVELQGRTANGSKACWDVDGGKLGVYPGANAHKLGICRNIPQTRFAFDELFPIPGSQPVAPPHTGVNTKRTINQTSARYITPPSLIRTGGYYAGHNWRLMSIHSIVASLD